MSEFKVTSPEFKDGDKLSDSFRHDQDNASPELRWEGAPKGTGCFAVAMHDKDAPTGGAGWWHWMVVGIPAGATGLARDAGAASGKNLPQGAFQMENDGGERAYMGCYPPKQDAPHEYKFTVYALPQGFRAQASDAASTSQMGFIVNAAALAKASIKGYYGWPK